MAVETFSTTTSPFRVTLTTSCSRELRGCLLKHLDMTLESYDPYSPFQLMHEFEDGIAWVTSEPVRQWYHAVDDQVKGAFSAWIEHTKFFQSVHLQKAGPGVVYAYWVCLYQSGHTVRELEADFCLSCRWHGTQMRWYIDWSVIFAFFCCHLFSTLLQDTNP